MTLFVNICIADTIKHITEPPHLQNKRAYGIFFSWIGIVLSLVVFAIPMDAQMQPLEHRAHFLDSVLGKSYEMPLSIPLAEVKHFAREALSVGATTKNMRLEARGLLRLSQVFTVVLNQTDSALLYDLQAIRVARAARDSALLASALLTASLTYLDNFNNFHQAEEYALECARIAERIGEMPLLGFALNIIGDVYLRLGNPTEASKFCRRSLDVRQASNDTPTNIAWSLDNIGRVEQALGNIDTAIGYHRRSLGLWQAAEDKYGIPQAWKNLGAAYSLKGNHTEAIFFFHQALELRQTISTASHYLPPLLTLIAREERIVKRFTESLHHAKEALHIAEQGKMQQYMALACRELALTYKAMGNFEEALGWQERSSTLNDSAAHQTMQRAITEMNVRVRIEDEASRQATQIQLLEQNNQIAKLRLQQEQQTRALSLMGVVAAIIGAGLFFQRYRFLQELKRRAEQEAQRARISRNMHDEVGAGLTSISLLSELARLSSSPETTTAHVVKIQTTAVGIGNAMREIIWSLNPKNDIPTVFLPYLRAFAGEFLSDAGINFHADFPDFNDAEFQISVPTGFPGRIVSILPAFLRQLFTKSFPEDVSEQEHHFKLTGEARRAIFLVVKEALNNTVKYASAREVRFTVRLQNDYYEFVIADNGCGFVPENVPPHARMNGLENMRKRIEELHGTYRLDSAPNQGTTICFCVPLSA